MKALRKNLRRLALLMACLFLLLAGYGAYSLSTYGSRWFASGANTFVRQKKQNVIPGDIYDRSGALLASTDENGARTYQSDAAARRAMVHVLGDSAGNVNNGVESFMAAYLYGFNASFSERANAYFSGEKLHGDSVTLSVDNGLTARIASLFPEGKSGAVVVMNYRTGEVLSELSFPDFDPAQVDASVRQNPQKPFFNRAVQGLYTPGSTFKIVTALSALENLAGVQTRAFQCDGQFQAGDRVITDAGTDLSQNKIVSHGQLTLLRAFQVSCNNTFARLALELTDAKLRRTAETLGFNVNFLFRDLVVENSSYPTMNRTEREVAWTGAGQSALLVTPMHLCMIASAVANDGLMMEPALLLRAVSPAGRERAAFTPRAFGRVMTEADARTLQEYMRAVVTGGTGTRAAVSGHTVCGKTGSAEIDGQENTNAWFTGFLLEEDAPYAVTVVVENAGGGGSVAAPIAGDIFKYLTQ
ncbi:MAG: hypothetical protein MR021_03905 [Clostridiales bacterium]|nr:hypothetical protein [Clostridiales bacterium]